MATKDILETEIPARLKAKPDLVKDINAVVRFNITGDGGGMWSLDCTKAEDWVSAGEGAEPKLTVTCSAQDFEKIVSKQMNPTMAAMSGKLKFKPSDQMGLAMKLAKLMG